MKKVVLAAIMLSCLMPSLNAQTTDPTLAAAVGAQIWTLDSIYSKRHSTQEKIFAAQGLIVGALGEIHKVEKTVLDYMSNASSAMNDLYQLKRCAELVTDYIPNQIIKMSKAVPSDLEGTAVTALTTKTATDVSTEMVSLYGLIGRLVTSSYSVGDKKDSNTINLLSAAERFYIVNEVTYKLEKIYRKLWVITWQIENLGWEDAWRNLDPAGWSYANNGKTIADGLIKRWQNAKPFK